MPVAGPGTNINLPWHHVMMPFDKNKVLIENSVYTCAMAGCKSICIVCNDDIQPLIKNIVGDQIQDPVYRYRSFAKFANDHQKTIPIFYAPMPIRDLRRRDNYAWSALWGCNVAYWVKTMFSRWSRPDRYYVSFPMSAYDVYDIRQHRQSINHKTNNFFLSYDGDTVKNNKPIAFTITGEDFKQCRRSVNKQTTREYLPPSGDQQYPTQKIPLSERWSARQFTLQTIFKEVNEKNATKIDLSWYYDISSWSGYRDFLASDFSVEKPSEALTKARKHAKLPYRG